MRKSWDNPISYATPKAAFVPPEVHIGNVRVAPATVLAPMAGVTDTVFRRFIRNASVFPGLLKQKPATFRQKLRQESRIFSPVAG